MASRTQKRNIRSLQAQMSLQIPSLDTRPQGCTRQPRATSSYPSEVNLLKVLFTAPLELLELLNSVGLK